MSFKMLYHEGGDANSHLASIAVYIDSFAKNLGMSALQIDSSALQSVAAALVRPDFPHIDGLEKASPFKKAANFFVWFVAEKPIIQDLPDDLVTPNLKSVTNYQNVIFAYHMAIDCLHGATLYPKGVTGKIVQVRLVNKIIVSLHYFTDFVEAFSAAVPNVHFKPVSLIFEQLAYKANPKASYDEVI